MIVSTLIEIALCILLVLILHTLILLAVVIGFKYDSHTVSEGVDIFMDITVDLLDGGLGQEVVVTVNTQAGTAKGRLAVILCSLYLSI